MPRFPQHKAILADSGPSNGGPSAGGQDWSRFVLLAGLALSTAWAYGVTRAGGATDPLGQWIWPAMSLHQCEELIFTGWLLGRGRGFLPWVRSIGFDLTMSKVLLLNVGVGWPLAIGAGLLEQRAPTAMLFVMDVEMVNAFWHVSMTTYLRRWSPGTLSSIAVTIPLGLTLNARYFSNSGFAWSGYLAMAAAIAAHYLFMVSLPRIRDD